MKRLLRTAGTGGIVPDSGRRGSARHAIQREEAAVGTKDKGGGKASKKTAQRNLKEKRQAKKQKKAAR